MSEKAPKTPQILATGSGPSIFVEGVNQLMLGFPVSRLTFFSIAERSPAPPGATETETRHIACELVMSTPAMIEMATNILAHLAANKNLIESAKAEFEGRSATLMAALIAPPTGQAPEATKAPAAAAA